MKVGWGGGGKGKTLENKFFKSNGNTSEYYKLLRGPRCLVSSPQFPFELTIPCLNFSHRCRLVTRFIPLTSSSFFLLSAPSFLPQENNAEIQDSSIAVIRWQCVSTWWLYSPWNITFSWQSRDSNFSGSVILLMNPVPASGDSSSSSSSYPLTRLLANWRLQYVCRSHSRTTSQPGGDNTFTV